MKTAIRVGIALLLVVIGGLATYWFTRQSEQPGWPFGETIERERVTPAKAGDLLADDRLHDKQPAFDPDVVDSRPFGTDANQWQINQSAAVFRLDIRDLREDRDQRLLGLHASYAAAAAGLGDDVLPSVNLVGGKAKQFDDGLYAALDLHMCDNTAPGVGSVKQLVLALRERCKAQSAAYAWLWGALEVGGFIAPAEAAAAPAQAASFVARFMANPQESKPVGFYEWTPELKRAFMFFRFLQQEFPDEATWQPVRDALRADETALAMYRRMVGFYARLTNPMEGLSLLDMLDTTKPVAEVAAAHNRPATLRFLPYSDSKENRLFARLYPLGFGGEVNLMRDLVTAIRDGRINLAPTDDSGWYDHQVYALESFVLPQVGVEKDKLLLTAKYKQRLLEAFKAIVTKYRETHIRQMAGNAAASAMPPTGALKPRLRVEPNPTYFLRVARSYAFLQSFLATQDINLSELRGLKEGGLRALPLGDELEHMRALFCGLHLVSCEDIGQRPALLPGELKDPQAAMATAAAWLQDWRKDPDLAVDTRVAVPVFYNAPPATKFWATIGVRAVPLNVAWARTPKWRPMPEAGRPAEEWRNVEAFRCESLDCLILVDEFAEFELKGMRALPRSELRKACDAGKTREGILEYLRR